MNEMLSIKIPEIQDARRLQTERLGRCFHCGHLVTYTVANPQPSVLVGRRVYPICKRCAKIDAQFERRQPKKFKG